MPRAKAPRPAQRALARLRLPAEASTYRQKLLSQFHVDLALIFPSTAPNACARVALTPDRLTGKSVSSAVSLD